MDFTFKLPIRAILAAPSSVGKSFFLRKLLLNDQYCFNTHFDKIVWVSGVVSTQSNFFDDLKTKFSDKLVFYAEFPEEKIENGELFKDCEHGCLILGIIVDKTNEGT